jgi:CFEM domain
VDASIPYCADACVTLATDFDYAQCLETDDLYYACCASPEFLGTIAICIHSHCNPDEWSYVDVDLCQGYGETAPIGSYLVVLANASLYATGPPTNLTADLTDPIKFSESDFEIAYRTASDFDGNYTDRSFFG